MLKIIYTLTKTNELLSDHSENTFYRESEQTFLPATKNKSRRWKYTQPDLIVNCFICDNQLTVKYNLPRQQYSQKNLWGYWTEKKTDQNKYICNACLKKILLGKFNDWGVEEKKSQIFHVYLSRNEL